MSISSTWSLARQFLFRSGSAGIVVPPLDGPLTPNDDLESARVVSNRVALQGPTGVCVGPMGQVYITDGDQVLVATPGSKGELAKSGEIQLPGPGGSLTASSDGHALYACVEGVGVVKVSLGSGPREGSVQTVIESDCATDVAELPDGRLVATEGSTVHPAGEWARDLLEKNRAGRLLMVDIESGQSLPLAEGLAYPSGVAVGMRDAEVLVTEAWSHSLSRFSVRTPSAAPDQVWRNFPGYPGQLVPRREGGYWLSVFALRTHLVEFVLLEDEYRQEMMATVDPAFWIRPAFQSLNSGLEPLQGGQLKKLGKTKPWAPARSYGLLVRLDEEGRPLQSHHSRPGAETHGVVSACSTDGGVLFASVARAAILHLPTAERRNR